MDFLVLTKSNTFLIKYISWGLGYVMEAIYNLFAGIGIENIALCIVVFTILVKVVMLPLTIRQTKFTKVNAIMTPELQAIQAKYKGADRKNQTVMARMQAEQQAVYNKYGTSPTGGCLVSLIQLPILFGLYPIIYNIPAYVGKVRAYFETVVTAIMPYASRLTELAEANKVTDYAESSNRMIDLLTKFDTSEWAQLAETVPEKAEIINSSADKILSINSLFGFINLTENPSFTSFSILIPILAGLSQYFSIKLTTKNQQQNADAAGGMASTMNQMNLMMPIISVVFCFMMPAGVGLYWIVTAIVTAVIQIFVNKKLDKVPVKTLIEANIAKMNKKRAKKGLPPVNTNQAKLNRELDRSIAAADEKMQAEKKAERDKKIEESTEYYQKKETKPGSLASRARMVKDYEERKKDSK